MFEKRKKKIKKFLSMVFDIKKWQLGAITVGAVLTILAILGAAGVGAYAATRGLTQFAKDIISGVISLMLSLSRVFLTLAVQLLGMVTASDFVRSSITGDPVTQHGWSVVRDFANMFVVLGFVIVGIATILRIKEYEATKTLLPLIIVALLINFSPVICGIAIDASNITMDYFLNAGGEQALTQPFIDASVDPSVGLKLASLKNQDDQGPYIILAGAQTLSNGLAAMVFFMFGILFLLRHVALICLVILSPLAFVAYAFDKTRKSIFDKWAQQFTQWVIMGIPSAFFIYIAAYVRVFEFKPGPTNIESLAYWIPVGFLMAAYTMCFQTSAMGAGAAMGLVTGAAGMVWGATKWGGKKIGGFAANRAKKSEAGQKITGGIGRAMDILGGTPGKTDMGRAGTRAEIEKNMGNIDPERVKNLAFGKGSIEARTAGADTRAAAMMKMAKDGRIGEFGDLKEQNKVAEFIETHGGGLEARREFETYNPLLAPNNQQEFQKIQKEDPSLTDEQIKGKMIQKAISRAKTDNVSKWTPDMLASDAYGEDGHLHSMIELMNKDNLSNLSSKQLQDTYDKDPTAFTPEVVKNMNTKQTQDAKGDFLKHVAPHLTKARTQDLDQNQIKELSNEGNLPANVIRDLASKQIEDMDKPTLEIVAPHLNKTQTQATTEQQLNSVHPDVLQGMAPNLSVKQIPMIDGGRLEPDIVKNFDKPQLNALEKPQLLSMNENSITNENLYKLTPEQVKILKNGPAKYTTRIQGLANNRTDPNSLINKIYNHPNQNSDDCKQLRNLHSIIMS